MSSLAYAPVVAQPASAPERQHAALPATTFAVVDTLAGFLALEAEWNALFDRAGRGEQMFQQFNWLWHWTNHYSDQRSTLAIVTGHRAGRLILVLPLLVERTMGLRQLAFMGAPVSQYGDAIVDAVADPLALLADAWTFVRSAVKVDLVRLAKVRADAQIAPLLASVGFQIVATEDAPFATLAGHATYADFELRFSPKLRKNRRRQLRRLEERGPLAMQWLTGCIEAAAAVRLTMHLKCIWLAHKGLVSKAFADTRLDAFFADAAASTERPCGVAVSVLMSNGQPADLNISVSAKGRRAIHILAYDLAVEKLGAGNHHLELDLQRAFDDNIAVYDFLAPRHDYKMEWADGCIAVNDHAMAVSPLGRAYTDIYLARIRETAKRALKTMPKGLRRLLARLLGRQHEA